MRLRARLVNGTLKGMIRLLCRVDDAQLGRVPERGPLIIVANHVNFLEVPLLYTHLLPRPVTGFAKAETWDNPAMAALFDMWEAIPLRRGEADHAAIRRALHALREGQILALAPEGTRSGNGRLQPGHPGVVTLALLSGAPLLPVVYYGGERFRGNLSRLRRTDFHIVVGRPFRLEAGSARVGRDLRQRMVDEVMYQLAALLPPDYRGAYADLSRATQTYLRFPEGSESNLLRSLAAPEAVPS
jgi:1-acyl-sn-glycerol-3-phosphate acyltransferase